VTTLVGAMRAATADLRGREILGDHRLRRTNQAALRKGIDGICR
jgi:hypothetical protein